MRARTLLLSAVLIGMFLGSYAPPAQAQIEVGQGITGVSLGDSKQHVLSVLGKPYRSEPTFLVFPRPCLCTVEFKRNRVTLIDVLSKTQRTDKGIGPGSSFEEMSAAYPEVACRHPKIYGPTSQLCVLRSTFKGRSIKTVFAFFDKALGVRDVEIRWR